MIIKQMHATEDVDLSKPVDHIDFEDQRSIHRGFLATGPSVVLMSIEHHPMDDGSTVSQVFDPESAILLGRALIAAARAAKQKELDR